MSFGIQRRKAAQEYALTISVSPQAGGSVTSVPAATGGVVTRQKDGTVAVTFTASSGWSLLRWEQDGVDVGTTNPITVTMNTNHILVAICELISESSWVYSPPSGNAQSLGRTRPSLAVKTASSGDKAVTVTPSISSVRSSGGDQNVTLRVTSELSVAGSGLSVMKRMYWPYPESDWIFPKEKGS